MRPETYRKRLATIAIKWTPQKRCKEIWIRLMAAHLAERKRAAELRLEAHRLLLRLAGIIEPHQPIGGVEG